MGRLRMWWTLFVLRADIAAIENKHIVDEQWIVSLQLLLDIFGIIPLNALDKIPKEKIQAAVWPVTENTATDFINRMEEVARVLISTRYIPATEGTARIHYNTNVYEYLQGGGRGEVTLRQFVERLYFQYAEIFNYLQEEGSAPQEGVEYKMKAVMHETVRQLEGVLDLIVGVTDVKD